MLTDEQVIACLSHEGDRVAMLNAAYRMGMLRAAGTASTKATALFDEAHIEYQRYGSTYSYDVLRFKALGAGDAADAIRAEAGETSEPRKGE